MTVGEERFNAVIKPTLQGTQRASALPFGNERVLALMQALCLFGLLPTGFRNADLCAAVAPLLGQDPATYSSGKMTYDLRRLRLHGLIERIPRSNRYRVTPEGMRIALFYTRAQARFFRLACSLEPSAPLGRATRIMVKAKQAVDDLIEEVKLAA